MKWYFYIGLILAIQGCFIEEKPLPAIAPFDVQLETDLQGQGQIFFSLKDRQIVAFNSIYDWDLGFSCRSDKFNIILNSAKGMAAYNTDETSFTNEYPDILYPWVYDNPNGSPDSSSIGTWGDFSFSNPQSYEYVYIINLGFGADDKPLGLRKFKVEGCKEGRYKVRFATIVLIQRFLSQKTLLSILCICP